MIGCSRVPAALMKASSVKALKPSASLPLSSTMVTFLLPTPLISILELHSTVPFSTYLPGLSKLMITISELFSPLKMPRKLAVSSPFSLLTVTTCVRAPAPSEASMAMSTKRIVLCFIYLLQR